MKRIILLTIATFSLLNAGLFDFLGDKEEVKKKEVIVEKCRVLEKVLDVSTHPQFPEIHLSTKVTGTTSCDSTILQYRFSCNHTLVSIKSGNSYNGVFTQMFYKTECLNPSVRVSIK